MTSIATACHPEYQGCDYCGSSGFRRFPRWVTGPMDVVVCRDCGLIYSVPRPGPEDLARAYRDRFSKRIGGVTRFEGREAEKEPFFLQERARALRECLPIIERHLDPRGRRILDVRSTFGGLAAELLERGAEVEGLDLFPASADWVEKRLGCRVHRPYSLFDLWEGVEGPFDAISMLNVDVVSHLASPRSVLRGAHDLLAPRGWLFLAEVDVRLPAHRAVMPSLRFPRAGAHLHHLTPRSLRAFLEQAGFEVVAEGPFPRMMRRWFHMVARRREEPRPPTGGLPAGSPTALFLGMQLSSAGQLALNLPLWMAHQGMRVLRAARSLREGSGR